MVMRRRSHKSVYVALAAVAALLIVFLLLKQAPPEAARLLPESDAIVFVHMKTLRSATHFDASPVVHSADYQKFIDATGIAPERDLDTVAFALHRMADPRGPNGAVAYSEVFTGRFDGVRLSQYLGSIASRKESYAGHDIYTVPVEGRMLRIAQLGYDTIGASNMPTVEQIHSMLDRHRTAGLWTPGSSLLAARYREVPLLSQAWAIGHIGLPFSQNGHITVLGLELPLSADTDLVASLRYSGAVHLRVEEIAPNATDAAHTLETMNALLGFMRNMEGASAAQTPANSAMRSLLESVTLEQHNNRAILAASASTDDLRALASTSPTSPPVPDAAAPAPAVPSH